MLPPDLDLLHIAAIGLLAAAWAGYTPLLAAFARGTLNVQLGVVRTRWIAISLGRENKTFDAVLLGHIVHSVAFFGSATLIVLAALVGTLASVTSVHGVVVELPMIDAMSLELFSLKLAVIFFLLLVSFFSFTYALRKLIYTVALAGGLPEAEIQEVPESGARHDMVEATGVVLTEAVKSFNSGIRGYYFAVAALFFFIGPIPCMVATVLIMALLIHRQIGTRTARAIGRYVKAMDHLDEDV